ncbi:MAG: carbohydrate kinase family protein [Alphaproteobacteria bacterium]|nr:carbohydrate kinase family protein [Alphaproteobacteria bacterium]MBU0835440.1 carbohydrate kinase family protein [Alphaproteobacteria bacterium]MBU1765721.1 carbohydrate kinase family protein [Alphaproteobacteria bacterium]
MRAGEEVQIRQDTGTAGGIVCVGNFIVDRIHTLSYWPEQGSLAHILHQDMGVGGGAANVVTDLASLGFKGRLSVAGAVGDDREGAYVRDRHAALGIDVAGLRVLDGQATAHTHVMNVPGQSRTFFYHGGSNDLLTDDLIDPAAFAARGHRIFYLGYLMLLPALDRKDARGTSGAARLLKAAREAGLTTCVDFVSSEDPAFADQVAVALPHCDYVIVNETEAGRATDVAVRDKSGTLLLSAVEEAGQRLLDGGVAQGVVIHAPELSIWLSPDKAPVVTPALAVDPAAIVSPVGAGDAFCAAVLYGLHEGWPIQTISVVAHRAAVHCLGGATATDGIPDMSVLLAEI